MNELEFRWRFKPSAIEVVCLIGGAFFVIWYAWLLDDACVYFRYVDNLVIHGNGLVWNAGEYVEGFSSPIWVGILTAFRWMRMDYWVFVRVAGLLSFVAFWWLACLVNRGLSPAEYKGPSLNLPLVYLSFTYGVSCYFTSGLEAPLVNVAAMLYAAAITWPRNKTLQVLVGLTPMLRHELIVPFLIFVGYALFRRKVRPWPAIATFVTTVGAYSLFRIWYYADLLPNTFYLKNTVLIEQGFVFLFDTAITYHVVPSLVLVAVAYLVAVVRGGIDERRTVRAVCFAMSIALTAYVIKIGGDPRHFRYLAFPYILTVAACGGVVEMLVVSFVRVRIGRATLVIAAFGVAVASCFPAQLSQHPIWHDGAQFRHEQLRGISDAAAHRHHKTQLTPSWNAIESYLSYGEAMRRYELENQQQTLMDWNSVGRPPARSVRDSGGNPILIDHWCQTAYLHPAWPVIQNLGLTEAFLARTDMPSDRAAHKYGLRPLAFDMLELRRVYGFDVGVFEEALSQNKLPEWMNENLDLLQRIERKVYNQHRFIENLQLALTPLARVQP